MNISIEDIDTWVLTEYLESLSRANANNGDKFNSKKEEIEDIGDVLGKTRYGNFLDNLPDIKSSSNDYIKNYSINLLRQNFNDYAVVYTKADGTCFVHSFLTSVSGNYRKLSLDKKESIGQKFRTEYYYNIIENIDANDKTYFPANNKTTLLGRIKNKDVWFENHDNELFLKIFKFNLVAFKVVKKPEPKYNSKRRLMENLHINAIDFTNIDDKYDSIITYNSLESHYSAVYFDNKKFILPNKIFLELYKKYAPGGSSSNSSSISSSNGSSNSSSNSSINNITNKLKKFSVHNNISKGLNGISKENYATFLTDIQEKFDRNNYKNTHTYKCISDEIGYILKGGSKKGGSRKTRKRKILNK